MFGRWETRRFPTFKDSMICAHQCYMCFLPMSSVCLLFLSCAHLLRNNADGNFDKVDIDALSNAKLEEIEACIFYVFSRICDDIQDNYIFSQPGIQRMLYRLEELIKRIDGAHFGSLCWRLTWLIVLESLQQNSTNTYRNKDSSSCSSPSVGSTVSLRGRCRWSISCGSGTLIWPTKTAAVSPNSIFVRRSKKKTLSKNWELFFSADVCAALLMRFSNKLKELEFQDMLLFLQNPPTNQLASRDIDSILSQAFVYKSLFENAKAHLQQ